MKGTSFRTLMLLTTLFAVVVIFQGTVRSPQPAVALVQPTNEIGEPRHPQAMPDKAPTGRPKIIMVMAEAPPVWPDDEPEDPNEPDESPQPEPE